MDNKGSFMPIVLVMLATMVIAFSWNSYPPIKNTVHAVLDPTLGVFLNWHTTWGMILIVFIITLITTLVQKYGTDQETLRELRKEQKILQEEMKKYKEHPEKLMELQKKQFEFLPKTMMLSMRTIIYTGVPFVLLFRWFYDYFSTIPEFRFFGFITWFWFYLILAMVFSGVLRKKLNVV